LELEYDDVMFDAYDTAWMLVEYRRQQQPVENDDDLLPKSVTVSDEFGALIWARSLLRASQARSRDDVERFRSGVLDGQLLTLDDVQSWVERQLERDGTATMYARVVLPDGWQRGDSLADAELVERSEHLESLKFAVAGLGWQHERAVARGGVLDRLRVLSVQLADAYGWQPAQAVVFVLTDATPVVQMLRSRVPAIVFGRPASVRLDVHPDVPADVVRDAYMSARRNVLGAKPRTPSARSVELVTLAAEHPSWEPARLWRRWNDTHEVSEQYADVRALRQALRDARRRVDGQPRSSR
jgi:hypothetical protein